MTEIRNSIKESGNSKILELHKKRRRKMPTMNTPDSGVETPNTLNRAEAADSVRRQGSPVTLVEPFRFKSDFRMFDPLNESNNQPVNQDVSSSK